MQQQPPQIEVKRMQKRKKNKKLQVNFTSLGIQDAYVRTRETRSFVCPKWIIDIRGIIK